MLALLGPISRLSWKTLYKLSDYARFILFDVFHYRQKVILENLRKSFPDESEENIQKIAQKFYRNFTDILFESVKLYSITREDLLDRVEIDTTLLDKYYEQDKNVIVVAGHLGNWEMLNLFASVKLKHHMMVVYHQLENDTFEEWFKNVRTRFGGEMIPMQDTTSKALLKRDKPSILVLINDQSPQPERAYWTTFLNQDTGVFRGVELIARRMDSPVLYMGVARDENRRGYYKVSFKLITETPKEEPNNRILENQMVFLEREIRDQPDNWLWSHKRWKHKRPANLKQQQVLQTSKSE